MNTKSLLLASLVLATPACAVSAEQMDEVEQDALEARAKAHLGTKSFLSKSTAQVTRYKQDATGEWVPESVEVRHRLRFVPAGRKEEPAHVGGDEPSYSYDGPGVMEYEAVVETVEVRDPTKSYGTDFTYYVKRKSGTVFRLFDCDSTRRCYDDSVTAKLAFYKSHGVERLRLSGLATNDPSSRGFNLEGNDSASLELELEAPAAPAVK